MALEHAPVMSSEDVLVEIRLASANEGSAVASLIDDVVREIYGDLVETLPKTPANVTSTHRCWIVDYEGQLVAVGIAEGDFVEDLWVRAPWRSQGIGERLLVKLEEQIRSDGYASGRLRVVARNEAARRFYIRHGWCESRSYPHERDGHMMVDFEKLLV